MTTIYLGKDAYSRSHGVMPEVLCINQFLEAAPTQDGIVLLPRPALKAFATAGSGPIRGVFRRAGVLGGDFVVVSGSTAYRVSSAGVATSIGTVSGSGRVDMAGSAAYMVIVNGTGGYCYDGVSFAAIAFPDGAGISTVDYINGYFLFGRANSQAFYWSAVNGVTVDALDYASAERTPDNIVCIRVINDEVWLFGETSIEVWVPTGQADLPFERINGRVIDRGCINRDTVARLDNTLFWVGDDKIIYRASESGPLAISTNSLSERIRNADSANLRAWAFTWDGHPFYTPTIDDQGTFGFDVLTGAWCEFSSYGRDSWRAHVGAYSDTLVVAGDDETGQLWQLSDDVLLDGADPISFEATGLLPVAGRRFPVTNFALDMARGTAPTSETNTYVEQRSSDDAGRTWSDWESASLGVTGEYNTRIVYRRQGQTAAPGRVYHIRMTSPIPYRLTKASVNELFP